MNVVVPLLLVKWPATLIYFPLILNILVGVLVEKFPLTSIFVFKTTDPLALKMSTLANELVPVNVPFIVCTPVPINRTLDPGSQINVPLLVKFPHTSKRNGLIILNDPPALIVRLFTAMFAEIVGCRPVPAEATVASILQEGTALQGATPQLLRVLNDVSAAPCQVTEVVVDAIGDPIQSSVKPVVW